MKQKPWSLVVLAFLHIVAPFGNLILNAIQSGRSLQAQWDYWMRVMPPILLFVYIGVPVIAGVFIYVCRRWSYWGYLACLAVVLVSNLFSFWTQMSWASLAFLLFILVADLMVVAYFVVPSVQKIYLDPRLRWWEASPRYHLEVDGVVNSEACRFKNLGIGGLLIWGGPAIKEGDLVQMSFAYDGQDVQTSGVVVYSGQISGQSAHGVKFSHAKDVQEVIRRVIEDLDKKGKIVRERMPGPDDRFSAWLKKLFTTGQGLFPSSR